MTNQDSDLDRLLTAANPIDESRLPLAAESASAQQLYEKITGTPYAGRPQRRRRQRWLGPGLAALVAAAGIGGIAAYASSNDHVSRRLAVVCYASSTLDSEAVQVTAQTAGPVATCAQAWVAGHVGKGPVPLLVACVTPQGVAAVFPSAPGADLCAQLGLPALPAGATSLKSTTTVAPATTAPRGEMPSSVLNAIVAQLRASCLTADQASALVRTILTKAQLPWSVSVPTPFPAGRPCASPGFDEADQRVILTGIPAP